jgi:hypothetical protein
MAKAANFLVCSSVSEAAEIMRGRRREGGEEEEEEEEEMARRKVSLCLHAESICSVAAMIIDVDIEAAKANATHRNKLPTREHTRARTSPFLCCSSEQSRGSKLHSCRRQRISIVQNKIATSSSIVSKSSWSRQRTCKAG